MLSGEELRVDGRLPAAFWVGLAWKAGLVVLLLLPLLQPTLEHYEGKGMSWRILVYPFAGVIVPVIWRATGSRAPYPYLADNLLVLAPVTDMIWNTLDAYDRVWWWDDVNHLLYGMVFAAVIGLLVSRSPVGSAVRYGLALGLGVTLLVLWEIGEYAVILTAISDMENAYDDTVGDLVFGLAGSMLGAAFAVSVVSAEETERQEREVAAASSRSEG